MSNNLSAIARTVIIPRNFTNPDIHENYFNPRYTAIQIRDSVRWVNLDVNSHLLDFYTVTPDGQMQYIHTLGPIPSGAQRSSQFDTNIPRIDYICRYHENEIGSIVIYPGPENQMTNTQRLRFLSRAFNIPFPGS